MSFLYRNRPADDADVSLKLAIEGAHDILSRKRDERHVRMSVLIGLQQSSEDRVLKLRERVELELNRKDVSFVRSSDDFRSMFSFFPLIKSRDVRDELDPRADNVTVPFPLGEAVNELVYPNESKPAELNEHTLFVGRDLPWGNPVSIPYGTFFALLASVRAGKTFFLHYYWDLMARLNEDFIFFIMNNKEAITRAKQADFGLISMFPELGGEKRCKAFFSPDYGGPQELREDVMRAYRKGVRHFVFYSMNTLFYKNQTDLGWFWAIEDNINETEDLGSILIDETLHWYIDVPPTGEIGLGELIPGGDMRANAFWMQLANKLAEARRGCGWSTQSASAMREANPQIHAVAKGLNDVWFVGATPDTETLGLDVGINTKVYPDAEAKLVEGVLSLLGEDIGPQREAGRFMAAGKGGSLVKMVDFLTPNKNRVRRFSRREEDAGFGI